eukprot:6426020-Alexandrium_andersonii.AAC.1
MPRVDTILDAASDAEVVAIAPLCALLLGRQTTNWRRQDRKHAWAAGENTCTVVPRCLSRAFRMLPPAEKRRLLRARSCPRFGQYHVG